MITCTLFKKSFAILQTAGRDSSWFGICVDLTTQDGKHWTQSLVQAAECSYKLILAFFLFDLISVTLYIHDRIFFIYTVYVNFCFKINLNLKIKFYLT